MRLGKLAFSLFAFVNKPTQIRAYGGRASLSSSFSKIPTPLYKPHYDTKRYFAHEIDTTHSFLGDNAMTRRRLYTEHKYVTYTLSEFSRFVAKTNFSNNDQISIVKEKFEGVKGLMHGHAAHENERIHELLRRKGSHVQEAIEADHAGHDPVFHNLDEILESALTEAGSEQKKEAGYQFYLEFQKFEASNLMHQFYEETQIMPELHRLYTDEEILEYVDKHSYEQMSGEDLAGMMQELFPHFNKDDRYGMLNDIRLAQPTKFQAAFSGILPMLSEEEGAEFTAIFLATTTSETTLSDKPNLWSQSAAEAKKLSTTKEDIAAKEFTV
ncbi:MAG: hypothetical protein C0432_05710 [Candidatus Puniceispirillum sp.]|nr:hypothetical protein [Candidatus Puniceispirillum sp.]